MFFNWYEPRECRHKYEGRWDDKPPSVSSKDITAADVAKIMKAGTHRIYVRDVCVRCGKTIERGA